LFSGDPIDFAQQSNSIRAKRPLVMGHNECKGCSLASCAGVVKSLTDAFVPLLDEIHFDRKVLGHDIDSSVGNDNFLLASDPRQ
jgi:hypothetical protein